MAAKILIFISQKQSHDQNGGGGTFRKKNNKMLLKVGEHEYITLLK